MQADVSRGLHFRTASDRVFFRLDEEEKGRGMRTWRQ